jgi:hypothetical protein
VPVWQDVPADPIDARVVTAFFEALSPVELDVYTHARARQRQQVERIDAAQRQQLERLRYAAALCARQFRRVDPDHRLVAAELERRWEAALRELSAAETADHQRGDEATTPCPRSPELRAACLDVGRTLPGIWATEGLSPPPRKALWRCLLDKVVVPRLRREAVQTRLVWKGGATTTFEVPVTVGAFTALSAAAAMEPQILSLLTAGPSDEAIATQLTQQGYRSPTRPQVLPSTVKPVRLNHGLMPQRHQSHPRRMAGVLTVPQLARVLAVTPHGVSYLIRRGVIASTRDPTTGLSLFPDGPETLTTVRQLRDERLRQVPW